MDSGFQSSKPIITSFQWVRYTRNIVAVSCTFRLNTSYTIYGNSDWKGRSIMTLPSDSIFLGIRKFTSDICGQPWSLAKTASYLPTLNAGSNFPATVGLWAFLVALLTCSDIRYEFSNGDSVILIVISCSKEHHRSKKIGHSGLRPEKGTGTKGVLFDPGKLKTHRLGNDEG